MCGIFRNNSVYRKFCSVHSRLQMENEMDISIISGSVLLLVRDWGSNPKHPTRWEFFCNLSKSLGPLLKNISHSSEQLFHAHSELRKHSHRKFIKHLEAMNLYGLDSSLFELGFSDPSLIESISSSHPMITSRRYLEREEEDLLKLSYSILKNIKRNSSPPKHRHDGTSPLPLGMDWSPPPRKWVISVICWVWVFIKKMKCYLLLEMLACLITHMMSFTGDS